MNTLTLKVLNPHYKVWYEHNETKGAIHVRAKSKEEAKARVEKAIPGARVIGVKSP